MLPNYEASVITESKYTQYDIVGNQHVAVTGCICGSQVL